MREYFNLDRFPIDRPQCGEWLALVEWCQAELVRHGMFNLEGMMHADAVRAMAEGLLPKFAV